MDSTNFELIFLSLSVENKFVHPMISRRTLLLYLIGRKSVLVLLVKPGEVTLLFQSITNKDNFHRLIKWMNIIRLYFDLLP